MSESIPGKAGALVPPASALGRMAPIQTVARSEEKMLCDRCGVEMYRMHAVWRCPGCGFKTDCCGW